MFISKSSFYVLRRLVSIVGVQIDFNNWFQTLKKVIFEFQKTVGQFFPGNKGVELSISEKNLKWKCTILHGIW